MGRLVRCVKCDAIFLKTPYDQVPEYGGDVPNQGRNVHALERDDYGDFLKNHHGHRLEDLTIVEDSLVGEREYAEPVNVSYFKATNGKERFVIKRHRERIDDPLRYELIHGDYSLNCVAVDVQSREISQNLERVLRGRPALAQKIHAFIKLYQQVSRQVDLTRRKRVAEGSDHSLEVYYRIDEVSLVYLLRNCRTLFEPEEFPEVEAFIYRHKDDGVLLMKATYEIQVKERVRSAEETSPASFRLKKASCGEKV